MISIKKIFFFSLILIYNVFYSQTLNPKTSIQVNYNQFYHFFNDQKCKNQFSSGVNFIYSENIKNVRISLGFSYSTKNYKYKTTNSTSPVIYTKYRIPTYSVPIYLSIFIINKPKNQFGFDFGITLKKLNSYKIIKYYDNDTWVKTSGYIYSNLGLSALFGLAYRYYLKNNLSLNFSTITSFSFIDEYKRNNSDNSNPFYVDDSNPSLFLNFGLEYSFNKSFVSLFLNQNKPTAL
jgi:hypothetical protein